MGLPAHMQMGQVLPSASMPASYAPAGAMLVGQALGTRPPIFTGPPPQVPTLRPHLQLAPRPHEVVGHLSVPCNWLSVLCHAAAPSQWEAQTHCAAMKLDTSARHDLLGTISAKSMFCSSARLGRCRHREATGSCRRPATTLGPCRSRP